MISFFSQYALQLCLFLYLYIVSYEITNFPNPLKYFITFHRPFRCSCIVIMTNEYISKFRSRCLNRMFTFLSIPVCLWRPCTHTHTCRTHIHAFVSGRSKPRVGRVQMTRHSVRVCERTRGIQKQTKSSYQTNEKPVETHLPHKSAE